MSYKGNNTFIINKASIFFIGYLLLIQMEAVAQSVDCETPCGACVGGLNSITLQYTGNGNAHRYSVTDESGNLGNGFMNEPTFTIESRNSNQSFRGEYIEVDIVIIQGGENIFERINISCIEPIYKGISFGDLKLVSGSSLDGGELCCSNDQLNNDPPIINNCPTDLNVSLISDCSATVNWVEPTATDDSGISDFTSTHSPGDEFSVGTTEVTYTVTDNEGATSKCSFNVIVEDNIDPVFTFCDQSKIKVEAENGCSTSVGWTPPEASDNCSLTLSSNYKPGDIFPEGKTTVVYTATDPTGNTSSCSFDVQVKVKGVFALSACPDNIIVPANSECNKSVNWIAPDANCQLSLNSSHNPEDIFPIGTTTVTYTVSDFEGVVSSCSFNITVTDETTPTFTSCPSNINISANENCEAIAEWVAPTASDNCNSALTITSSHNSGDTFSIGTTEVTYTATDDQGNEATCSFNIIVTDETEPIISDCPENIVTELNTSCQAIVYWKHPTVKPGCSDFTVFSNYQPGDNFPVGTTEVVYTSSEENVVCSFNISVEGIGESVISNCPEDIILEISESEHVSVDWDNPILSNICGSGSLSGSHEPGDLFSIGNTEVEYTYANQSGEILTCTFNVIVTLQDLDFNIPQLITPNNDGYNDVWEVENLKNIEKIKVVIVDRWGSEVYSKQGNNDNMPVWKGTNRSGKLVPTGTYYYFITVNFSNTIVQKSGFIELVH